MSKDKYSSVAQWRSNRLLTGRLLVRVQPEEFFIGKAVIKNSLKY